jgi:hypothetical protein
MLICFQLHKKFCTYGAGTDSIHSMICIYRVSIKSFPDYKHLLQENYVEYKHFFFQNVTQLKIFFLQHISTLQHENMFVFHVVYL